MSAAARPVGTFRALLGESALWLPASGEVAWVDIEGRAVIRTDPASGREDVRRLPDRPTALADLGAGLVVARDAGIIAADGRVLAPNPAVQGGRFNDGTAGPGGRFWITTLGPGDGRLHCLAPKEGGWRLHLDLVTGLGTPNGLAFSPDGRRLYLSDSRSESQGIWRFAHDPQSGTLSDRRLFFATAGRTGRPDGATTDSLGNYWFAAIGAGEVVCLSPDGTVLRRIALPVSKPTRPALGGPDGRTLFVTSIRVESEPLSGRLLALPV